MDTVAKPEFFEADNGRLYYRMPCPRCQGGTMAPERESATSRPYLKCILCGHEEPITFHRKATNAPHNKVETDTKQAVSPTDKPKETGL
jgi:hypothetical protein